MIIKIEIDADVPDDEVLYILNQLQRSFVVSGIHSVNIRIFNSAGDPVGRAEIKLDTLTVPVGASQRP